MLVRDATSEFVQIRRTRPGVRYAVWLPLLVLALTMFLPPYSSVPVPQQDMPALIKEVLVATSGAYLWLSPAIHVSTIILLAALLQYGRRIGRVADGYFAALFVFFAFAQNFAITPTYGFVIVSGNLVMMLAVALYWVWETYRPGNEYVFRPLPRWRYWVIPLAFLAFWFPASTDLTPDLSPVLLLTSAYGVAFCPTTPVVLAILTLIFPRVNRSLLRVTGFVGLLIGAFNVLSAFVMVGYTPWLLLLHTPLISISLFALVLPRFSRSRGAAEASRGALASR